MDFLADIGNRLRKMRENKGMSAKFAGDLVGITKEEVYAVERGDLIVSPVTYDWLCAIYGTTFKQFMAIYKWSYKRPEQNESEEQYCA